MTQWSPQQDRALGAVGKWIKGRPQDKKVLYLAGFAGTGKTTLARHLAEDVEGTVLFGAFTGKAALVLRQKGCPGATTIHSMIYHAQDPSRAEQISLETELADLQSEPDEALTQDKLRRIGQIRRKLDEKKGEKRRPSFKLNMESDVKRAQLVIIDECSMVDRRMAEDLLSFGTPILVLGDPAQLPPVGDAGYFTSQEPDLLLTEVHRQARDSAILRLATQVREGQRPRPGVIGLDCEVLENDGKQAARVMEADQIIVGRNATRHGCNQQYRRLMGINHDGIPTPQGGDKLVCLRNNHEVGLLNGSLWRVHEADVNRNLELVRMTISSDEGQAVQGIQVDAHLAHFEGREQGMDWWALKQHEEFDYGYALTCHKSQGSQWDDVVVYDESSVARGDRHRWLYTAVTRAAKRLTVIL